MTGGYHVDAATGEAVAFSDDEQRSVCEQYVAAHDALEVAREELRQLEQAVTLAAQAVRDAVAVGKGVKLPDGVAVVVEPGWQGRRSVSVIVAEEYAEQLETLGLGGYVTAYKAPTLAQVNALRANVIAAGVPLDRLVAEPLPGPAKVTVVRAER